MRLTLTFFLRPLAWAAIAISAVAVGLGRSAPRTLPSHHQAAPRYQGVNGLCFPTEKSTPRFFDRETGRFFGVDLAAGDSFDHAVCSPWRDDRGQYQIVGRWMNRTGEGSDGLPREFGLARYTFPEGRIIDRIALDLSPVGEPCWLPGLAPRILFASGDGHIYRYSFDEANGLPAVAGEILEACRPRRLTWRTGPPGVGPIFVQDLTWPSGPKLGGRLIASLSYQIRLDGKLRFVGPQLWWLALNGDGTVIESAGRLTPRGGEDPARAVDLEERLPSLAPTPEGGLALAYLARARDQTLWDLRVAKIASDPETGAPMVGCDAARTVARHCLATAPVFSADGRWIYGILRPDMKITRIAARRFSVAGALSRAVPRGSAPGERPRPGRADSAEFVASRLVEGRAPHHAGH